MEPSKTHKSRLPHLISRAWKRAPSKNTNPPKLSAPDRHAPKASMNFFKKLGFGAHASEIPRPKRSELRPQYPAAGHGGGCFPRLFKRRVNGVPSSKTLSKDMPKALPPLPHVPKEQSPISKRPQMGGVSLGAALIPNPTHLRCIRESFDFIDISPKCEHPSAFESRNSKNLALATDVVVGNSTTEQEQDTLLMEPSNVSLNLANASPDASVAVDADILPTDVVEAVAVSHEPSANTISSIPFPIAPVEELGEVHNDAQECVVAMPVNASLEVLNGLATPIILSAPPASHKIEAFGTNPVLADDIVQAFIQTKVASRRQRCYAQTNISFQKLVEILAILEDRIFSTAVDELDVGVEASIIIKNCSPVSSNSSAEDTPDSEDLSPVLSFADSESVYSCSSTPYSDHEEHSASLSQNESDFENKCFRASAVVCKEGHKVQEKAGLSSTRPRSLAARRARPGLFITIPPGSSNVPIALANDDSDTGVFHSFTTERLNGLRASRTTSATFVPFQQAPSSTSSSPEETSNTVPETSTHRRTRRHGTIYRAPPVPALDPSRYEDPPSSSSCSTPGPISTPSGGSVSENRSSIFYRSELKSGLRPLMLPQYAGEGSPNNGLRSILKRRPTPRKKESPVSAPSSSENASPNSSSGTGSNEASPAFRPLLLPKHIKSAENASSNPAGGCRSDGDFSTIPPVLLSEHVESPASPNTSTDCGSDMAHPYLRTLLLPEHIKLRKTTTGPRLDPQPGPAF